MSDTISVEDLQQVMPRGIAKAVTHKMVSTINDSLQDTELAMNYRDNLISYTSVMREGKFKMQDYLNAVKYVSFKLLGSTNIEAYTKTFPERYNKLVHDGVDDKRISSYVAGYNKTILVNKIFAQTMVPFHVLNQDLYQKALNKQAQLMSTANSEMVQTQAANSLLMHLKPPEVTKIELDVGVVEGSVITELKETMRAMAQQQQNMIQTKVVNADDVARSPVILEHKKD